MQPSNKKEVSCNILKCEFDAVEGKGIDTKEMLKGIPYPESYLKNKHERIEWWVYCKIISNLRAYFTPQEFENMGKNMVRKGFFSQTNLGGFILFSSNKLSRLLTKQIFRMAENAFECVRVFTEFPGTNKLKVTLYLDEEYEFCPEFYYLTKGTWIELGRRIGRKDFKVDINWIHQGAILEVSWAKEGFLYPFSRNIRWLFQMRNALLELNEMIDSLKQQEHKLEASKRLLQKQTTQLQTTYEITKSIRQSLNIQTTLTVIADSLIREAGFSFVSIRLFKDIDGNEINIEVNGGTEIKVGSPVHQFITINETKIGELILYPKVGMDDEECDELLQYIGPIINISIHDSLVLRSVVDYRDNLEQKVTKRTIELQKARDGLSDTNVLLKEAQQLQNSFFTNISHEFRTPLTLILGPAKQLSEQLKDEKTKTKADLIHRSAKKLNRLVDELLDISKIESGEMKLQASPVNIVTIVNEITLPFYLLAERKNIVFNFISAESGIIVFIDKDKVEKIITNVLSNAFKFTPENGKVNIEILRIENDVQIIISDTGIGIPKDQINKIFDRFYQVDGSHTREQEGTGIGLALTKELIELHKGKIEVESEESKGTTFRLIFPLGKDHLRPEEICEKELGNEFEKEKIVSGLDEIVERKVRHLADANLSGQDSKQSLLIIEDNSDVRKYISMILGNHYHITEAKDGEEGLNKSFELIPDLIISDVMMPKIDGFQLCSKLKTDSRTSHIPVIMVTAKATMKDKINGLEIGADDYIMKPFEASELIARIKNLLEQRKRVHEHFRKFGLFEIEEINITPVDKKFLEKAVTLITKHISDLSFGVEILADNMAMSRSLLFKKISSLTGESPIELIRRVRLEKAAKLIESNGGNISEIALEVGFSNPSYFSECFRKQFGIAPSQYHTKTS